MQKASVITPLASPVLAARSSPNLTSKSPRSFFFGCGFGGRFAAASPSLSASNPLLPRRTWSLLVVVRCCGQACNFPITSILVLLLNLAGMGGVFWRSVIRHLL